MSEHMQVDTALNFLRWSTDRRRPVIVDGKDFTVKLTEQEEKAHNASIDLVLRTVSPCVKAG